MPEPNPTTAITLIAHEGEPRVRVVAAIEDVPDGQADRHRVYAIEFANHPVKIGVSRRLRARIKSIRSEHARFGLSTALVAVAFSEPCFNAAQIERELLLRFADARVTGEYVDRPFSVVVGAMNGMEFRLKPLPDDAAKEAEASEHVRELIDLMTSRARSNAERMAKLEQIVREFADATITRDRRSALRLALEARRDPSLFPQTKTTIEDIARSSPEIQAEFLKEARLIWGAGAEVDFRAQIAAVHRAQQH